MSPADPTPSSPQPLTLAEAIRYATGDDCKMTDGEAAVAIKELASAGYVLVERALVEDVATEIEREGAISARHGQYDRLCKQASRLRATLEPKP